MFLMSNLIACADVGNPNGSSTGIMENNILYVGTMDGEIWALYAGIPNAQYAPGDKIWSYKIETDRKIRAIYGTPAILNDRLLVGGYDGFLYMLSNNTGSEIRKIRVGNGDPIVGGPVVANNTVLIGSSDGKLYAFQITEDEFGTNLHEKWSFRTGNKIWSAPSVDNGVVYFGSLDHKLYAINLQDGKKIWEFLTNGAITTTPLIMNNRVFFGSFDNIFYSVDAKTGIVVAKFSGANGWFWASPIAINRTIYAPSLDGNLYAMDDNDLNVRWILEGDTAILGSPAPVGNRIAVASANGKDSKIVLANLDNGVVVDECNIGKKTKVTTSLTTHNDSVFFTTDDHGIRTFRIKPQVRPIDNWVHFTNTGDSSRPERWERSC